MKQHLNKLKNEILPLIIVSLLLVLLANQVWSLLPEMYDILIFAVILPVAGYYMGEDRIQVAEVFGMFTILIAVSLIFGIVISISLWILILILLLVYLTYFALTHERVRKKIKGLFV